MNTTIQLEKSLVNSLSKAKEYPRQTYNELIHRMLEIYTSARSANRYDEFLHMIQQSKMKELWDNKEDEEWESV